MDIYHVLNRGVEKRDIVQDNADRFRFVHSLFVFNDSNPLDDNHTRKGHLMKSSERKPLVHLYAWCLMTNHYHLLLSPVDSDPINITRFMKKLNMGYARYFNERHDRSGYLWQGRYKKLPIVKDAHFIHIPSYIHLNPLDLKMPEWRTGGVKDTARAFVYLKKYRWSSFLDYMGEKNLPSLLSKTFLTTALGDSTAQRKNLTRIITTPPLAEQSVGLE